MSTAVKTKPARVGDDVRTISLPVALYNRVEAFADANLISVSAALREFMAAFAKGKVVASRKRSTRRVNVWLSLKEYAAFTKARKAQGVSIAEAIEAAMGDNA
jgi:hypothetical protein